MGIKSDQTRQFFSDGYNCTQSLLASFGEEFNLDQDLSIKLGTGLGAGLGYQGKICGAVLGAYMIISLKFGSSVPGDEKAQEFTYHFSRKFDKQFKDLHGSFICADLLNVELSTPIKYARAEKEGLFEPICPILVQDAAKILEEILSKQLNHE